MKAEEFVAAVKSQIPDRKYLYWDDEHRMMLEITRTIAGEEIYYDVVYGPFDSFGVNNWAASLLSDDFVFAGYFHEYANGHITNDYFQLKVKFLIPKGMQIEYGDAVAPAEEHERSEKDAMWERD